MPCQSVDLLLSSFRLTGETVWYRFSGVKFLKGRETLGVRNPVSHMEAPLKPLCSQDF